MDVRRIVDIDKVFKHFDKLGEFMDGVLDDLDGVRTFGGDPREAGIKVTKSKVDESPLVIVEVEVPGCTPKEVEVDVAEGGLSVRWTPRMTGRRQERTFSLSKSADLDRVRAEVRDGYLTVTVPSSSGKPAARKVEVT